MKHLLVSKVVHIWQRVLDGAYVLAVMLTLHCLVLREHESVLSDKDTRLRLTRSRQMQGAPEADTGSVLESVR